MTIATSTRSAIIDHDHEHAHDQARRKASGSLVLIGDALHNVLDGVLIAAAFLTDVHLGIVTALAIMAHEIPQEVGNFAVLLHSGVSRRRALALNLLTSLSAVIGGVVGFFALEDLARGAAVCAGRGRRQPAVRGGGGPHPRAAPARRCRAPASRRFC